MIEPPREELSAAQLLQPDRGGKLWRAGQDDIGLSRKNLEAEFAKLATKLLPCGDDFPEVRSVIGQTIERRQRADLAEAVDVVAVAHFVERGNELAMPDEISDALEAKGIGLREGPCNQHVWMLQAQRQRVVGCEVHIGLIQDHHTL